MRTTQTTRLAALFLTACLAGMSHQAQAQDTSQDTSAQDVTQTPPQTAPPTQMETTSAPPGLPRVTTVPSYQANEYGLTSSGSVAAGRSEVRRWPNRPLLITSTLMLTASYVPAVFFAAYNDDTTNNLYIPVAGPWMELAQEPASGGSKALLAISGVFQDLGALGLLTSLFVPERRTSKWYLIGNKKLSAAPAIDRYTYGISARGHF